MKKLIFLIMFILSYATFAESEQEFTKGTNQAFGFEYEHYNSYLMFKLVPSLDMPFAIELGAYYSNDGNNNAFDFKGLVQEVLFNYNRLNVYAFGGVIFTHVTDNSNFIIPIGIEPEYFLTENFSISVKGSFYINVTNLPEMGINSGTFGSTFFIYF